MSDCLTVTNLKKHYPIRGGTLHAVDDVSFSLRKGESLGLVGESGCGKSTVVRLVSRLIDMTDGSIACDGSEYSARQTFPSSVTAASVTTGYFRPRAIHGTCP